MKNFVTENPWGAIRDDLKGRRAPVVAVVSFVGADGDTLLPLKRGDSLVCNADEFTVKSGLTNPLTLQRFQKRGVHLYSIQGLHAKVIVGEDFAWVGSANASDSGLLEAIIRVGRTESRAIRDWARSLCTKTWRVSPQALTELLALKSRPSRPIRKPPVDTIDWSSIKTLQLWWFGDYVTRKAEIKAQAEIKRHSVSRREATYMRSLGFTEIDAGDRSVTEGQWLIPFNDWGRPKPSQVVRITPYEDFKLVWFKQVKTARTASLAEIESIVPGWRENYDDWGMTIRNRRKIQQIGDLYS